MEILRRGLMLVLSSPSGAGKTTISRMLLERDANLCMSVSVTTRPARPGEVHGRDYYFIDPGEFERMVEAGALLEHALVFGNRYGTPKAAVEQMLAAGRDVLFDIDWQGTQQLGEKARDDLVSVFVLPPSTAELERRLRTRAADSEEEVQRRMSKAADEMSHWAEYQYVIVNRDLQDSVAKVQAILTAERLKRDRQSGLSEFVRDLREGG
ncbi:MAG: guanylate kinase [Rhodospirillales bacterium]|nr:guanylate kinase [Rhodospirillales bacterium]